MEAGEYDTNTLVINNISSVAYRIYEPAPQQSSTYTFAASDVERTLRNDGHLVYADSLRRGIWCFHLMGRDGSSIGLPTQSSLGAVVDVCGYKLALVDEGILEPPNLLKSRPPGTNPINTPNSSTSSGSALDTTARSAQSANNQSLQPSGAGNGTFDFDVRPIPNAVSESKGYGSIPIKEVYDYFITAVLSSLSAVFCSKTRAIALNSKSILLPSPPPPGNNERTQGFPKGVVATFRVYLTTTGSLLISLCHSVVNGLVSVAETIETGYIPPGKPVLAAPFGVFATLQGVVDGDYPPFGAGTVQSPDTQISRIRPDGEDRLAQWRKTCTGVLEMRGISPAVFHGSSWVSIQCPRRRPLEQKTDGKRTPVVGSSTTILWPSELCFWKPERIPNLNSPFGPSRNGAQGLDPLLDAKTWFLGSEEREVALTKRTKERETDASREAIDADGRAQNPNGYSPLALHRAGNTGATTFAAGTVYPTPPDGVQNPVGATPSFDGAVSSPGNNASATAMVDVDTAMANSGQPGDPFGDSWDGDDVRREKQGAFLGEPESLFGDIGADIFTNEDVTDADFSFFDADPGGAADLDFSGVADMVTPLDPGPSSDQVLLQIPQNHGLELEAKFGQGVASPVFAKPELRHARSSLVNETQRSSDEKSPLNRPSASGVKRQPSPFNPETVYKRVKASLEGPAASVSSVTKRTPLRRGSLFEKVEFDPFLSFNSKKYEENGRFAYHWPGQKERVALTSVEVPTTDYLRRHGKGQNSLKELPSNMSALIASITGGMENSSLQRDSPRADDPPSDADDVSLVSDQDDSSYTADDLSSPAKSAFTRRRAEDDAISVAASLKELEGIAASSPQAAADLSKLSNVDSGELSISRYFADLEPPQGYQQFTDEDFVTIAQILTEQAVGGCLRLSPQDDGCQRGGEARTRRQLADITRHSVESLRSVLPASLGAASSCQFKPFLEVQDVPLLGQPNRMQPRPPGGTEQLRPNLFQIPAPHFEMRRHESKLSVAPSAVDFWEVLGLGPSQGAKDVNLACVYPNHEGMAENVKAFLDRVRILYEALKLGNVDRLASSSAGVADGLVPFQPDGVATPSGSASPRLGSESTETMGKLCQALAAQTVSEKNFIVFFIYSPDMSTSIIDACAAFQLLFELLKKKPSARSMSSNELVLQLVPLDFLFSATSLVLPQASDYIKLCLEMYDRCTLFGGPMPSPAIVLEQPLPRGIDFKLATASSANLFHENSCIHIAYAQSVDERWVTAAWTDNRGCKQMTASYCLGRKGRPLSTPLADVAHEIWDTTHDLISIWKVNWRVIITKCGPMGQDEVDFWVDLGKAETKASINLTLLTVDTNPSLQLVPPVVKIPAATTSVFYTTPVSTPQASIVSPEQSGNPSTPMAAGSSMNPATPATPGGENVAVEPDSDTTLVDATDTTWGSVVCHRLNNSPSLVDLNPALVSGYLIKRGGTRVEDPPAVMEVNVIHSEGNSRPHEALLREMLTYFRGLGMLARVRSIVDRERDVRPWHVAAAEKGVQALYKLL